MKATELRSIMLQSWQLIKSYGLNKSDALKKSWQLAKLKSEMQTSIVKFRFEKLNGEVRTAWGTLQESLLPESSGSGRRKNDSVFTYFDTEKNEYRSFKKVNIL